MIRSKTQSLAWSADRQAVVYETAQSAAALAALCCQCMHWQQPLTQAAARDKGGGPSPAAGREQELLQAVRSRYRT